MERNIKILKFQKKQKEILSEDEIIKIFVGLVRLVQKSADYNAAEKIKNNINGMQQKLEETNQELKKRTIQVEELLKLNNDLIQQLNSK